MSKKTAGEEMLDFAKSKWTAQEDIMSMADRLAQEREAPTVEQLESKLTSLRAQMDKTKSAPERIALQAQIDSTEVLINEMVASENARTTAEEEARQSLADKIR